VNIKKGINKRDQLGLMRDTKIKNNKENPLNTVDISQVFESTTENIPANTRAIA
jgi:hypothetical protein